MKSSGNSRRIINNGSNNRRRHLLDIAASPFIFSLGNTFSISLDDSAAVASPVPALDVNNAVAREFTSFPG